MSRLGAILVWVETDMGNEFFAVVPANKALVNPHEYAGVVFFESYERAARYAAAQSKAAIFKVVCMDPPAPAVTEAQTQANEETKP